MSVTFYQLSAPCGMFGVLSPAQGFDETLCNVSLTTFFSPSFELQKDCAPNRTTFSYNASCADVVSCLMGQLCAGPDPNVVPSTDPSGLSKLQIGLIAAGATLLVFAVIAAFCYGKKRGREEGYVELQDAGASSAAKTPRA